MEERGVGGATTPSVILPPSSVRVKRFVGRGVEPISSTRTLRAIQSIRYEGKEGKERKKKEERKEKEGKERKTN
jgi:hypothetical protein